MVHSHVLSLQLTDSVLILERLFAQDGTFLGTKFELFVWHRGCILFLSCWKAGGAPPQEAHGIAHLEDRVTADRLGG